VPTGRHESWIEPHVPLARLHESVRTQHVPAVPEGGAGPGAPVALFTHSEPAAQLALMLFFPQPSGRFVPHWPAPVYDAAVFGVQHAPVVPAAGGGEAPPVVVQVAGEVHAQFSELVPQPFGSDEPHLPAYVVAHVFALQQDFVVSSQTPLGHVPHFTVLPQPSSNVPHWNVL